MDGNQIRKKREQVPLGKLPPPYLDKKSSPAATSFMRAETVTTKFRSQLTNLMESIGTVSVLSNTITTFSPSVYACMNSVLKDLT